ncbi:MAG TPA: pinensin family lanthipeptide [Longimicrobium sp.]|nr:pinensin family lanthipeptide [Longimicrobium sp.]
MDKLKLSLDTLQVESFTTDREIRERGTVRANQPTDFNECGISAPCTTDGQNTIDASLCAQSIGGCGEGTINATTCRVTYICCPFSMDRTAICCQNSIGC